MISNAWYSILEYNLNFGLQDRLYDVVTYIHKKYNKDPQIKEKDLLDFLDRIEGKEDPQLESMVKWFYRYVPYRLQSPFFKEKLVGMADHKKNNYIVNLANNTSKALYKIDKSQKEIYINTQWMEYIHRNQKIVYGWLESKLIYFLQRKNPNVPAIPFKLKPAQKRNLTKAKKFWKDINNCIEIKDIYTELNFTSENTQKLGVLSIDHFIPWSFVLHDELWNLTPTFQKVNSSKNNSLPNIDKYIDNFCNLQYLAFVTAQKKNMHQKLVQDYFTVDKRLIIDDRMIPKKQFVRSLKDTILPLYQIAFNQGYSLWVH